MDVTTHFDTRVLFLYAVQAILRCQYAQKLDFVHYKSSLTSPAVRPLCGHCYSPGIPQSTIMFNAAHAVPPVAIRG